jgi:23S rRNA (uracil1939-C5)-methyltransferase
VILIENIVGVFMEIVKDSRHIIEITGMTHEGQGVGRIDGFIVFVDGALLNEEVEVKITEVKKSYSVGKLIKVIKEADERISPSCGVFNQCGGCSLQHMDYKAQLEFKTNVVRENIRRIGGIEGLTVHDAIGMENPFHYRNKAQYPVAQVKSGIAAGFFAKRSHEVIESGGCRIQDEISLKVKDLVIKFAAENKIPAYNEKTGKGL